MSRREQIKMTETEVVRFLEAERVVTCATFGPRGWPHLMPLWYVLREGSDGSSGPQIWAWTYASSQKVLNLRADRRASLLVEAGQQYQELRGVMFECDALIHDDLQTVADLGQEIFLRYAAPAGQPAPDELHPEVQTMVAKQARKRVALQFIERHRASWDHRKLDGVY